METRTCIWKEGSRWFGAVANDNGITALEWSRKKEEIMNRFHDTSPVDSSTASKFLLQLRTEISEYCEGLRSNFSVPVVIEGTEFQVRVWNEMKKIQFGQTITYGDLAKRIENPKASRAVGAACGQNRVPIIIPCHRVLGSAGKLHGFGGGLDEKAWLLDLEGASYKS
ncbi:MAG TPA: methylated-DNA--[protein]-cysteine S-methyltransferase [bacterium]|jgi:methylated-DNA-[protein]-cysteine S-methyltransferase